jgi:protein SCO1/2
VNPRVAIALTTLVVATSAALLAVALVRRGDSNSSPSPTGRGFMGPTIPPGFSGPDFRLRDESGKRVTLSQFRGRPVILTFLYSTCRDTCPATAGVIRQSLDSLGRDVPALAVSVDPKGDTPFHVRRFLLEQRVLGRLRYLTGARSRLAPVWKGWGIHPQTSGVEHTAFTFLLDRDGRPRVGYGPQSIGTGAMTHDLRVLLAQHPS